MKRLVQEITPLAFNNQFQEPKITNRISFDVDDDVDVDPDELKTNQDVKSSLDSTYETRPSDFRIKSIWNRMSSDGQLSGASTVDRCMDDNNFGAKDSCKQSTSNQTTKTASKSMRKLFNEFIADLNTSIERYCAKILFNSFLNRSLSHSSSMCVCECASV